MTETNQETIRRVADASGAELDELVALTFYFPQGYPPRGMYGVAIENDKCYVFLDGIGEFEYSPLYQDKFAISAYKEVGRPLIDPPGSKAREAVLRQFVTKVRGDVVDLTLVRGDDLHE